jgi:hypothetical protein
MADDFVCGTCEAARAAARGPKSARPEDAVSPDYVLTGGLWLPSPAPSAQDDNLMVTI